MGPTYSFSLKINKIIRIKGWARIPPPGIWGAGIWSQAFSYS